MSALARSQAEFQRHLLTGDPAVSTRIVGDARAGRRERLAVYYQAYRLRLIDVLRTDFDGLAALLAEDFVPMAGAYLEAHPSRHPSVRWLGRALPDFLRRTEPWSRRPLLAEMASFEWAWGLAFDAADARLATPGELAGVEPGRWAGLRLDLHPCVQRLRLRWNVPSLYLAVTRGERLPDAVSTPEAVDWLLWRRELSVGWRSLQADEAGALAAAAEGLDFAQLCEGLCRWHESEAVPVRAATLLKGWLAEGLISRLVGV